MPCALEIEELPRVPVRVLGTSHSALARVVRVVRRREKMEIRMSTTDEGNCQL